MAYGFARRRLLLGTAALGAVGGYAGGAATNVRPTRVGPLPPRCAALNRAYVPVTDLVVRAATDGDPCHIRHAATADPVTAATLPGKRIRDLWGPVRRPRRGARRVAAARTTGPAGAPTGPRVAARR